MDRVEQIRKIYRLSQFDKGLAGVEIEFAAIPDKLSEVQQDYDDWQGKLSRVEGRLQELEKNFRDKEATLADSQQWIKDSEGKLFRIKTNKEYQAALKEIAERKHTNKELETELLNVMGEVEQVQSEVQKIKSETEAKLKELGEEKATLEARHQELESQLADEKKVWEEKAQGIEDELLDVYKQAKFHNPDAGAMIDRGSCDGCHFRLPPQLVIEVRRMKSLHTCPTCQRVLFLEDLVEEDPPADTPPAES